MARVRQLGACSFSRESGHVYLISRGASGTIGLYKLEVQAVLCNGKLVRTGGSRP